MVEYGIFGVIIASSLWLSIYLGVYKAIRQPIESRYLRELVYVLPAVITYAVLRWFTGDAVRNNPTWTLFGVFWAVIWLSHYRSGFADEVRTISKT
jgi:hypothetical protein